MKKLLILIAIIAYLMHACVPAGQTATVYWVTEDYIYLDVQGDSIIIDNYMRDAIPAGDSIFLFY
jgi:hypothetical protein